MSKFWNGVFEGMLIGVLVILADVVYKMDFQSTAFILVVFAILLTVKTFYKSFEASQ